MSAPLLVYVDECAAEWYEYCEMFQDLQTHPCQDDLPETLSAKERGDDRPFPVYPYDHDFVRERASQRNVIILRCACIASRRMLQVRLCDQNDREGKDGCCGSCLHPAP